jgi:hypothetical protein
MVVLLCEDFNDDSKRGAIKLASDGSAFVNYPINDYLWEGVKSMHLTISKLQFAAGAKTVKPTHVDAKFETSWEASKAAINKLSYTSGRALVGKCASNGWDAHG